MWLIVFGGDKRDRTADLLHAMQALSQLSYTPVCSETFDFTGLPGYSIFLLSSLLRGRIPECLRSQLSYTPIYKIPKNDQFILRTYLLKNDSRMCNFGVVDNFANTNADIARSAMEAPIFLGLRCCTGDTLRSQLSYTPICSETLDFTGFPGYSIFRLFLMLSCCLLGSLRSQLSYTPMCSETLDSAGFPGYSIFGVILMLRCCLLGSLRS